MFCPYTAVGWCSEVEIISGKLREIGVLALTVKTFFSELKVCDDGVL